MSPYQLTDFSFELPPEQIALQPMEPRDYSRLLRVHPDQTFSHHHFYNLIDLLPPGAHLVVNNSKVLRARLKGFRNPTGGKLEFLLLREIRPLVWEGIMNSGFSQVAGIEFTIPAPSPKLHSLHGRLLTSARDSASGVLQVEFDRDPTQSGEIPLPPYIRRELQESDQTRYQTVYSQRLGSAAAPTAGLHFTHELIQKLKDKKISIHEITLHVGLGTFRPIQDLQTHQMHSEYYTVTPETASALTLARKNGQPIIAVGTTSVRTLESCFKDDQFKAETDSTDIFIRPDSVVKSVDGLITNFHLPQSTLLLLVSAFVGIETIQAAYQEAIQKKYRFYSYGDAMYLDNLNKKATTLE